MEPTADVVQATRAHHKRRAELTGEAAPSVGSPVQTPRPSKRRRRETSSGVAGSSRKLTPRSAASSSFHVDDAGFDGGSANMAEDGASSWGGRLEGQGKKATRQVALHTSPASALASDSEEDSLADDSRAEELLGDAPDPSKEHRLKEKPRDDIMVAVWKVCPVPPAALPLLRSSRSHTPPQRMNAFKNEHNGCAPSSSDLTSWLDEEYRRVAPDATVKSISLPQFQRAVRDKRYRVRVRVCACSSLLFSLRSPHPLCRWASCSTAAASSFLSTCSTPLQSATGSPSPRTSAAPS